MTETGVPPGAGIEHPIARAVVDAIDGLSRMTGSGEPGVWQLSGADCLAVKAGVKQLTAMLAAVDLQIVGELDAQQATVEPTADRPDATTARWSAHSPPPGRTRPSCRSRDRARTLAYAYER